jgi:glycosyltransferase involved in cell wall biosynthesis
MMLLDALALGAVGIASDIPESTSILPPGYPAFAAGAAAALSRRLAGVVAWDEVAREALKRRSREWVRCRYDWERIAARYDELYRRAVAG